MTSRHPIRTLVLTLLAVTAVVTLTLAFDPTRAALSAALHGDAERLRHELSGPGGALVLYALMLAHAVIVFPAEVTNFAAGYVFGVPVAIVLCLSGWLLSALVTYAIGRFAGNALVIRLAGPERLERFEHLVARGGWEVLVVARLIPVVPYSLVGYIAGTTEVPLRRFAWTTAVGSLPLIVLAVVLGARVHAFSASDPVLWIVSASFLALLALTLPARRWIERRHDRRVTDGCDEPAGP